MVQAKPVLDRTHLLGRRTGGCGREGQPGDPQWPAVGTIVGTSRADLNRTHVFNPRWRPHGRFHGMAGWGTITASQLLALRLVWRRVETPAQGDLALKVAALLPVLAWAPFFVAVATPGAGVEDEPGQLPRVLGIPLNLIPATLVPAVSALGPGSTVRTCRPSIRPHRRDELRAGLDRPQKPH
jgi:hypothetical protein